MIDSKENESEDNDSSEFTAHADAENEVYCQEDDNFESKFIYIYRITPKEILTYFTERDNVIKYVNLPNEIGGIIAELDSKIKRSGFGLGDLRWRGLSYFVIVYEDKPKLERGNAVTFTYLPTGGNHTFRGGQDFPATGDVVRFFCTNRMDKKGGGKVDAAGEQFWVTLNHPKTRGHSDTGTNTGPPHQ